ncbi:MAG: hypothetical protein WB815_12195, partial [Nitrososphaeraceae archaeon]
AFYALLAAGLSFIFIGTISAVYNSIPVEVSIDNSIQPNKTDIIAPNMNIGNTAKITVTGSLFNITITDPDRKIIRSDNESSYFHYILVAQKEGKHTITVKNGGNSQLNIVGSAYTKGNPIAFSAHMMLIITGVIVTGLSLKLKNR